jgi:hypothetical protein
MEGRVDISVENRLRAEQRDLHVYHHSSRSAHIISRSSSIVLPLTMAGRVDYLYISPGRGGGRVWKQCWVRLPSWLDFELSSERGITVIHSGGQTLLKIPAGRSAWQLKITRPADPSGSGPLRGNRVTIGEEGLSTAGEGGGESKSRH